MPALNMISNADCVLVSPTSVNKAKVTQTSSYAKKVSFKASVKCRKALHVNNYSDEEIAATWYNDQEFKVMRKSACMVAKMIEDGTISSEDCCIRGLEHKNKTAARRKRAIRMNASEAVLDEQQCQMQCGMNDDESIAQVYSKFTAESQIEAHERALKDQLEAQC